jgi:hypothetical protein
MTVSVCVTEVLCVSDNGCEDRKVEVAYLATRS